MKRAREDDETGGPKRPLPRDPFNLQPANVNVASIRNLVLQLIFNGQNYDQRKYTGDRAELPGPLPISINRKYLSIIEQQPYMVCEKSDGERAMLLALGQPRSGVPAGTYLLNRAFEPMTFNRAADYAAMLAPAGPTLLEGELLQRPDDAGTGTGATAVFMMFDCVWLNGTDLGARPLNARLQAVGEGVRLPFRKADDAAVAEGRPRLPLYMLGKFMVDKRAARDILAKVSQAGGHGAAGAAGGPHGASSSGTAPLESEMGLSATGGSGASRTYRDGIRVNGTDGLIFTPSAPSYRQLFLGQGLTAPLLKWKYNDENSVDFSITPDDLQEAADAGHGRGAAGAGAAAGGSSSSAQQLLPVKLRVNTGGREDTELTQTLMTSSQASAYLTLCDRVGRGSLIVEACFEPLTSSWAIRRVRDRKTRSNFIRTAWSTLEAVAENITAEEIVARLSGSAGPAPGAAAGAVAAGAGASSTR